MSLASGAVMSSAGGLPVSPFDFSDVSVVVLSLGWTMTPSSSGAELMSTTLIGLTIDGAVSSSCSADTDS
jgi:hypothetical protein